MKKKILLFFTFLMVAVLALSIVACEDYNKPDDPTDDDDAIARTMMITNGTFYDVASGNSKDNYLKSTVNGWTATKGSLSTDSVGVSMGIIDLNETSAYENFKDNLVTTKTSFDNPGIDPSSPFDTDDEGKITTQRQDTNALLIASNENPGSAYYKNNSSIEIKPDKYYKLTYSLCTSIETTEENKKDKGAWVIISGGFYYEDARINTDGKWETHTVYFQSNIKETKKLDIRLWLGHGPSKISSYDTVQDKTVEIDNPYLTKGAVLFDNIRCEEVTEDNVSENKDKANTVFRSMKYLTNSNLNETIVSEPQSSNSKSFFYSFREGMYNSNNVNGFEMQKGKKDLTTDRPNVNTPTTGIVDLSKLYNADGDDLYKSLLSTAASSYSKKWTPMSFKTWKENLIGDKGNRTMTALEETKALMIASNDLTAVGYTSSQSINIKSGGYYKISLWTYVYALENLPEEGKPSEPTAYTDWQKAFMDAREKTADYDLIDTYFNKLTTEEEKAIKDYNKENDKHETVVAYLQWLENSTTAYRKNNTDNSDYEKEVYTKLINTYLEKDISIYETEQQVTASTELKNYLKYKSLSERSDLLVSEDYKKLVSLEESWEKYNNDIDKWLSKYTAWLDATSSTREDQKPFAKVKLTGAGDDIEKTTQSLELDKWNKIDFYIQGNQLSDRSLNLEMWFGEGIASDYTTLMMGGAFFDDISITEFTKEEAVATGENFTVLNKLDKATQLNKIGGLADTDNYNFNSKWDLEIASEDVAKDDFKSIKMSRANLEESENFDLSTLKADTGIADFYKLMLENKIPTASMLTNKEYLEIKPNTAYRIAMLVKTEGIKESLGAQIQLLGGEDKDDLKTSVSSATKINKDEWQEVVFYVLGDTLKTNYVTLKMIMGSGTRFDTASYVEGKLTVTLINVLEIKYSEYTASNKSGDITNSYTFSNSSTPSNVITNGNFSSIDLENTDIKEFDEGGKLNNGSFAKTKSWTSATTKNNIYTAPKVEKKLDVITWDKVWGVSANKEEELAPSYYEIWIRYKDVDDKYKDEYLTAIAAPSGDKISFNIPKLTDTVANYKVRAVGKSISTLAYNDVVSNFSNYSGEVQATTESGAVELKNYVNSAEPANYVEVECKDGTFAFDKATDFAPETGNYVSPFETGLRINSNYSVVKTLTSSSSNLDSNSYYRVGVWVKTEGGAKASVTLKNVNKVLRSTVGSKFIGYTNVTTDGKWVEYVFYIQVGNTSGSLTMELSLGNPYLSKASKKNSKVTSDVTVYETAGLSQGIVYFDNVQLIKVDEEEYEIASSKDQIDTNNEDILYNYNLSDINSTYKENDYMLYTNKYALRILECTIDSFDSFTENTETGDGANLGNSPKNYTWSKATQASGEKEEVRLYGVYSQEDDIEKLNKIYKESDKEVFKGISDYVNNFDIKKFLEIDGSNSLVMSNKTLFGQSYTVSGTSTINANSYYELKFKAKTLIARQAFDASGKAILDSEDNITYVMDKVNAEFRFMQQSNTDKYQSILINSKGRTEDIYEAVEYTMYIYNPSKSSSTANWSFVLGDNPEDEDKTGVQQLVIGMMVIDQVSMVEIDEDDYNNAKTVTKYDNLSDEEKLVAINKFYEYSEDADEEPDDTDKDKDDDKTPNSIWDRGDAWLLISSIVIGGMIIIVVVVMVIRKWRKKHPKKIIGENKLKAEEIKVVETKNDITTIKEDEEYSDEVKPNYVQRKVKTTKSQRKRK